MVKVKMLPQDPNKSVCAGLNRSKLEEFKCSECLHYKSDLSGDKLSLTCELTGEARQPWEFCLEWAKEYVKVTFQFKKK